jgi:hypothetical protein
MKNSFIKKLLNVTALFVALVSIALMVYIAGESALSSSPIVALLPVGLVLLCIVLYIRYHDKNN